MSEELIPQGDSDYTEGNDVDEDLSNQRIDPDD
jgi:hypothetical protein